MDETIIQVRTLLHRMIYCILFVLLASFAVLDLVKDADWPKTWVFGVSVVSLVFISGIRWDTGPDWQSYFDFYRDIVLYAKGPWRAANFMEPGYTSLNLLIHGLGFSYTGFLIVLAVITIGLKAGVFYRHRDIMVICLFLYFCYYLGDIASVRQFTAVSITLLATMFIINRKPLWFVLLVLVACSIHISSILFLGAYWIYYRPHSRTLLFLVLILAFILGITHVADYAVSLGAKLLSGSSDVAAKLMTYQKQGVESTPNYYFSFLLGTLKRIIVLPLFILAINFIKEKYKSRYTGYLNLLVFGNAVYFLFALSIPVIQRLSVPFLIFEIFLWGYLLVSISDIKLRYASYLLVVLFGAFRLYSFISPYKEFYIPFKTIFG